MCLCGADNFFSCLARTIYMTQKVALCLAAVAVVTCLVTSLVIAGGVGVGLGYHYCVVEAKTYQLDIQTFRREYNKTREIINKSQNLTDVRAGIGNYGSNDKYLLSAPVDDSDGETKEEHRERGDMSGGVLYGAGDSTPNDRDGNVGEEGEKEEHPPIVGGSNGNEKPSAVHLLYKNLDDEGDVAKSKEEERKKEGIGRGRNNTGYTRDSSPSPSPSDALESRGLEVKNGIRKNPHYTKDLQDSEDTGDADRETLEYRPISNDKSGVWLYGDYFNFSPYHEKQYHLDLNKNRTYKPEQNKFLSDGRWRASPLLSKLGIIKNQTRRKS